jgi:hypothetical protein
MNKEQFDALMGKVEGLDAKVTDLETKFSKPAEKPEVKPEPTPEPEINPEPATGVTAEQFSQLMEKMDGFGKKVDGIETKFNALSQEQGGQEPDPVGGETVDLV